MRQSFVLVNCFIVLALSQAALAAWERFEAEDAVITSPAAIADDSSASGGQYVGLSSGMITFTVSVPSAGTYDLRIGQSLDWAGGMWNDVRVNDVEVADQTYGCGYTWTADFTNSNWDPFKASISLYGSSWRNWQLVSRWFTRYNTAKQNVPMTVSLNAGANTIAFAAVWGGTNYDYIEIYQPEIPSGTINVTYTIATEQNRGPISPYIYGHNFDHVTAGNLTVRRMGGNRLTGYNWENNYSNAGSDWYHSSDNYMSTSTTPGKAMTDFVDSSQAAGQASLMTLQMAGYVAADKNGTVTEDQAAPSARWKQVVYKKGSAFCNPAGSPDTADNYVYMDELVNYFVTRYGNASTADGIKFYALDNEPALWISTHPRIHPVKPTCVELITRSTELSAAIKDVDPYASICGPALYGFNAFSTFQDATDWNSVKNGYNWFIDYYLDQMKIAGNAQGRRLLDVLDLHWYPEARDAADSRITDTQPPYSQNNGETRMQAPRTLWDTGYVETSWIGQWCQWALPLLPYINSSINTYYPDTKLAFTEFNYGASDHITGGIATADVLGIFGKYGVYLSTYWGSNGEFSNAAYNLYRNYDGANSAFGDTRISAVMSDKINSSIYGSTVYADQTKVHLVVLNKSYTHSIVGTFNITSPQFFTSARVWSFNSISGAISEKTPIAAMTGNAFTYTLPPLSAYHFVLRSDRPVGDLSGNCHVGLEDLQAFAGQWLDPDGCAGISCADLDKDNKVNLWDLALLSENWDLGVPCQ